MKIHFSGIGGIGLSGLARFLSREGYRVKGSDISNSPLIEELRREGIEVDIPQRGENIRGDEDLVIYSAAVKQNNPELVAAREQGISLLSRREALPIVLGGRRVFAVAGAHGKSTTSAILASILQEANAIIGAVSKEFGSNMRYTGDGRIVFEADESDGSFLETNPYCAIVTNAEPEHMEFYGHDLDRFYEAYEQFLRLAKIRVINGGDPFLRQLDIDAIRLDPVNDIRIKGHFLRDDEPYIRFELRDFGEFEVWGFGEHIALDASLAILAALNEVGLEEIRNNIKRYRGIKKRFDIVGKGENFVVIDDYAHHPTEIEATLASISEYARLKGIDEITIIWQPHKYSRLLDNLDRFIECFDRRAKLVILPVWAAGEEPVEIDFPKLFGHYAPIFADRVKRVGDRVVILKSDRVVHELQRGIVVGFGAGDITYQLRGIK
ncbi:MAG: UDP-N-acetylmuramate--L-alanine ligase [Epsilonproteobacteria bacterium]|nr:UDP-N-acetylmuramate--L-alanine ligase [Campylobacterota bacterium]NPA56653.1 UDP-N-acetylmuramate--L-alanine ligase [Campylobacterota bacterium]